MKNRAPQLCLDHLVIVASDLQQGVDYVEQQLGVDVPPGGQHPKMGTHNHLLALGSDIYLEVIAIDPSAPPPAQPRWFNLDQLSDASSSYSPFLSTWVVNTPNLVQSLAALPKFCGVATPMQRDQLHWDIALPMNGEMPMSGAFPSVIEWPTDTHPAGRMHNAGCQLQQLTVHHPKANEIKQALEPYFADPRVTIEQGDFALQAVIRTSAGPRHL